MKIDSTKVFDCPRGRRWIGLVVKVNSEYCHKCEHRSFRTESVTSKIVECKEIAGEQTEKSLREFAAFERMGERLASALNPEQNVETTRYTIYPHEIEEAIMRYLVAENGADYDKLCQADFTINIQGRTVDKNELVTVESDFKCARVTVDTEV